MSEQNREQAVDTHRIAHITLDEKSIIRRNADVEHERRVAIFDLLEDNLFIPRSDLVGGYEGPYHVVLRMEDNRLALDINDTEDKPLHSFTVPLTAFKRIIKEYFLICDSYYNAIKSASPRQIEAIDMGRRGIHNQGSELLMERLADKVEVDFDTARRLFTLICVLQIR
ncbi:UPF0262 family protein [Luteithermobacter gelatinilyticus]|uniref:UPF0262 family protein n=1 Tax=Luteithermobacter gelatinilyticus TaxID=2582913 RepID=UPI0011070AC2|nr:UPF0262 family protein [Luteithermobacter gelatinilyticus]|tara:strand:- start:31861 stop:32367 length:507 start_codon:yes stop_codon:yes gene_type:complete